jgi:hypothetical protein
MAEFVYTTVPGKIGQLLNKIREVGVPQKATVQWLKTVGYKSSNDASLLTVLKYINFIDSNGVPTSRWTQYRGTTYKTVLGEAIREGYDRLFEIYPDAHQRSQDDLVHVFSTNSSGGKSVISKIISTFIALSDQAEFLARNEQSDCCMPSSPRQSDIIQPASRTMSKPLGPVIHIDVQIHISPEASPDQIDQIFASMSKHLYGFGKPE